MPTGILVGLLLAAQPSPDAHRPVLVELFSSEGCSSCPAADEVLERLDREQPVSGAEVVALELHVDYWNRLGWTDPFSQAAFTARQESYAEVMGRSGIYTPQLVVDGAEELLGSKERAVQAQVHAAAGRPAARVGLSVNEGRVEVEVRDLPAGAAPDAEVFLALTERGLATEVPRGENAGRHLAHGPVVRVLQRVGQLHDGTFHGAFELRVPPGVARERSRAVVFVQEPRSRHILGAAQAPLSSKR